MNAATSKQVTNDLDEYESYFEEYFRAVAPAASPSGLLASISPRTPLIEQMESAFEHILGTKEFVFVTIHLDVSNLRRRVRNRTQPESPLAIRFVQALDAQCPLVAAYERLLEVLIRELEKELYGSRAGKDGRRIESIRIYENDGKTYQKGAPVTHVHLCIPLPENRSYYRFCDAFATIFGMLVYPVPLPIRLIKEMVTEEMTLAKLKEQPREILLHNMLRFTPGRRDGDRPHPVYSVKQIVNDEVFADRFFASAYPTLNTTRTGRNP
jgi:hypothetical protein